MVCVGVTTDQRNEGAGQSSSPANVNGALDALSSRLTELISGVQSSDLQQLAQLHTALGDFSSAADAALQADRAEAVRAAAVQSMELVEKIVLKEVDDANACLQQVARKIQELQALASGATPPQTPPTPETATQNTQADTASQVQQVSVNEADLPLIQEFITEATGHIEAAEAALLQLEEDASNSDAVNSVFASFHTIKGVAGFLNLSQISALAHAAESVLDRVRKGELTFDSNIGDVILQSVDAMRSLVGLLGPVVANKGGAPATLEGLDELLARLNACVNGGNTPASAKSSDVKAKVSTSSTETARTSHTSDTIVKVSTDRLDSLINMVGELVIAQAMVSQDMAQLASQDRRVARNLSQLSKITRELQDLSMSLRMVPIQGVFQKMARLVRDLARKTDKQIEFVVTGGETELDRNVVEVISDPLVHMIRNAVDHGIETPQERVKAGKNPAGKLTLRAYHQGGNICIQIADDGRGLDRKRILQKAIDNGLVRQGQELSDQEIFNLIFAPGLSTAQKVTDVSGRGVGMDVVKRNVEALRGQIDISSIEGKGTTFTIRLPLTLAVIDGLVVKVGRQRYIIPITSIEQSLRPRAEQISTVQNRGELCMVRDKLLPILRLHKLFNVTEAVEVFTEGLLVIVHSAAERICLFVDDLLGQQQVVIKSLGAMLSHVKGISGGAILGDGNVSLILDVPGLIAAASSDKAIT